MYRSQALAELGRFEEPSGLEDRLRGGEDRTTRPSKGEALLYGGMSCASRQQAAGTRAARRREELSKTRQRHYAARARLDARGAALSSTRAE